MNDFEDQLTAGLRRAAARVPVTSGDVGPVLSAGAARARRRTTAMVAGGVLTAAALVAGTVAVLGDGDRGAVTVAAGESASGAASGETAVPPTAADALPAPSGGTAGGPEIVPGRFTWRVIEGDSVQSLARLAAAISGPNGALYALATTPGNSFEDPRPVLASADGTTWEQVGVTPSMRIVTGMVGNAAGLYAVGTSPSIAGAQLPLGGDLVVGHSADGGANWATTPLPIDFAALGETPGIDRVGGSAELVASDDALLAIVRVEASPDLAAALPQLDAGQAASAAWGVDAEGVTVYAGGIGTPCAATTAVGADTVPTSTSLLPTTVAAATAGTVPAMASTVPPAGPPGAKDGPEVAVPAGDAGEGPTTTIAYRGCPTVAARYTWEETTLTPAAIALLTRPPRIVYRSTDGGTTFEQVADLADLIPSGAQVSAPSVAADGTFGIAGQVYDAGTSSYTAGFLVTSSDGVTWTRHDAPAGWIVPDPAGGWFSGPADWRGELPGVSPVTLSRSADGVTWTTTDITPVLATLGAAVGVQNTFAVAGGIAIAVQILGDPPATVTAGDLAGLWPVASAVLFTTDGQRWSIERPPSDLPSASSRAAGSQILASLYNPAGIVPGGPTSYAVGTPIG